VVVALTAAACGLGPAAPEADYANNLRAKISTTAIMAHLEQFQRIADEHGGTRQTGTAGYDASVDYVVKALQDRGFEVQIDEFELGIFRVSAESLSLNGTAVSARAVEYSGATGPVGITGPMIVVPSDDSPGCESADYDGLPVPGRVVMVDRGGCDLADKAAAAAADGAAGMIIANNVDEKAFSAALIEADQVQIPVVHVTKSEGARLRRQEGDARIVVDSRIERARSRSVIAETKTGSTRNVVLVGAHLDSVRLGPGINDNGTGVASVLETALQMGSSAPVRNAVRFAFWGGEEAWLVGSTSYAKSLDLESLKDIALYLNFDTVGSPNTGYLTLDGDASLEAAAEMEPPTGSAGIERALVDYLANLGETGQDLPFDGRGDYEPLARAGIPVGALCTGTEQAMSPQQAELWGGRAGLAFDPNYHTGDDTLVNVSPSALDITGPAIAYVVGLYTQDQGGRYGVPSRNDRTRQPIDS
jgi:Zn-dependent M28 family amino/carboxypeptidase